MSAASEIRAWAAKTQSIYFFLPDGAYGRPLDNSFYIKDIAEQGGAMTISLSDGITMTFTGPVRVTYDGDALLLDGFERLVFNDGGPPRSYANGQVRITGFF